MSGNAYPGPTWLLGVVAFAVAAGGLAVVLTGEDSPLARRETVVDTVINEIEVLPEGQAEVEGTLTHFVADDAVGPPLPMPIEIESGGATINGAIVDGERSAIVWDGGRPLRVSGSGAIDLGPTHIELGVGAMFWSLEGVRILQPGQYRIDTPVAVGSGGLARPRDAVSFAADDSTTIEGSPGTTTVRGVEPVHLEGPGSFVADGTFRIRTRDGTTEATHLEFGPGPFIVDLRADGSFTAVFNGRLSSS